MKFAALIDWAIRAWRSESKSYIEVTQASGKCREVKFLARSSSTYYPVILRRAPWKKVKFHAYFSIINI